MWIEYREFLFVFQFDILRPEFYFPDFIEREGIEGPKNILIDLSGSHGSYRD